MIILNKEQTTIKRSFIRMLKENNLVLSYKINFIKLHKNLIDKKVYASFKINEDLDVSNYTYSFNDFVKHFYMEKQ